MIEELPEERRDDCILLPVVRKGEIVAFTRLDREDVERFAGVTIHLTVGYASCTIKGKQDLLHRIVMNAKDGDVISHIGHILDNLKSNLSDGYEFNASLSDSRWFGVIGSDGLCG